MLRLIIINIVLFLVAIYVVAQNDVYDNDETVRLNPKVEQRTVHDKNQEKYPFIRYDLNKIELNGADWSKLKEKLKQSKEDGNFIFLHIGDSHIQADINTGTMRKRFQEIYGDAGRGLIVPFKLAGTNEPVDYTIKCSSPYTKSVVMRRPWSTKMGFTGISIHPDIQKFTFSLRLPDNCDYLTILGEGEIEVSSVESNSVPIKFEDEETEGGTFVSLDSSCNELDLNLHGEDANIFGFDLRNDNHGVVYSAIGNNGAAYATYNGITNFGNSIAVLEPDLIIISLGTNEAYGKFNKEEFKSQVDRLLRGVKEGNSDAAILLVTPSECQKSIYSKKTKKGRRTKKYVVNEHIREVREALKECGKRLQVPVYDFFMVAGGENSSEKWFDAKLLSMDKIHRTWKGYEVEGSLFFDALLNALSSDN